MTVLDSLRRRSARKVAAMIIGGVLLAVVCSALLIYRDRTGVGYPRFVVLDARNGQLLYSGDEQLAVRDLLGPQWRLNHNHIERRTNDDPVRGRPLLPTPALLGGSIVQTHEYYGHASQKILRETNARVGRHVPIDMSEAYWLLGDEVDESNLIIPSLIPLGQEPKLGNLRFIASEPHQSYHRGDIEATFLSVDLVAAFLFVCLLFGFAQFAIGAMKAAVAGRSSYRRSQGLCGRCGYDLSGGCASECPECGDVRTL